MPLLFTTFQSTMETKEGKNQWHPRLVKVGEPVTAYDLAMQIAKRSSLTPGDSLNVIDNLMDVIQGYLLDSRSVCLDRLGTFTITCRSTGNGVDTEEEVSASQITDLKVRFTPTYTRNKFNGTTRSMFTGVTFEKINKAKSQTNPTTDPDNGNNNGDGGGNDNGGFINPAA